VTVLGGVRFLTRSVPQQVQRGAVGVQEPLNLGTGWSQAQRCAGCLVLAGATCAWCLYAALYRGTSLIRNRLLLTRCNVVRWEFKNPTPFLRTREFLWQAIPKPLLCFFITLKPGVE